MTSVLWLRRDLRLRDHPALHEAAKDGPVLALFVLDRALLAPAGAPRVALLYRTLRALDADLREHGGRLLVRRGDPVRAVPRAAREAGASTVHVSADFGPYDRRRDDWHTGLDGVEVPHDPSLPAGLDLPDAGEHAALRAWRAYRRDGLGRYATDRDRPDRDATSRMSVHLKWGCLHPRTMLADLGAGDDTFRRELAWREFYATVLFRWPGSAREYFLPQLARMPYARADSAAFDAWRAGRTGFPIVDAGMRQLLGQGWMHNRVRMIVASFLVKDLHVEWQHGARHFMRHLVDADLASNQHGWQWTAGTGTDAAPYYRVFNPLTQGRKFDPDGDYVRRWVPELRGVDGPAVHEPWQLDGGLPADYPQRIVDHATERAVALERYQATRR